MGRGFESLQARSRERQSQTRSNTVGIAQLVSAPDCGSGGRGFEPHYPPYTEHLVSKCRRSGNSVIIYWAIAKR